MGTGEESSPAKPSKPASSNQEIPTTPSYPDWSSSVQAYYGAGATPPPFFASTVASPTPHPYIWGSQHPLIPPYGTPVPYPALYPAGGVYAHPNMAPVISSVSHTRFFFLSSVCNEFPSSTIAKYYLFPLLGFCNSCPVMWSSDISYSSSLLQIPNSTQVNIEMEGKVPDGKDRASAQKAKGTSGGKAGESGKAASGSGIDGASQSAESGSDGSSDASDQNTNQQEYGASKKGSFNQMLADANAHSTSSGANIQASVPGKPVVSMPATNLNIGMDLWNASSAAGATKMRPNPSGATSGVVPAGMPEQWIQDERELKRQKRKQSNRESARRSRLRKQAECEELQVRVESLSNDNSNLRDELQSLSEECNKLKSENDSIKEELTRLYGPEAVAKLEQCNPASVPQSHGGEGAADSKTET